jgi:hypothetical protein
MENDFAKIAVAFIVVGLPIIAVFGGFYFKEWLKFRQRQLELQASQTAEKAAQYAAHNERLEQRVRVLERIVTDKGIAVADEIENLRDKPLNS